jgi:hypothetical protein
VFENHPWIAPKRALDDYYFTYENDLAFGGNDRWNWACGRMCI